MGKGEFVDSQQRSLTVEPLSLFLCTVKEILGDWTLRIFKKEGKNGERRRKGLLLCVVISPDVCDMFQRGVQALKPGTKINPGLTTPSANSAAQKSIVLWDNRGDEWSGLSRRWLWGQPPSDHRLGLNSFMVHQGLWVPQKVSWSFFSPGPDGVLSEAFLMPGFPHVKLLGKWPNSQLLSEAWADL